MNIVTIGGGGGQYQILQAVRILRARTKEVISVTAIPTTTDSAGSSGVFRKETGGIAPGDISQCFAALHPDPAFAKSVLSHRFQQGFLKGHTLRNILVMSYIERFGATQEALNTVRDDFGLEGTIAPATFTSAQLHATLVDGTELIDEDSVYSANLLAHGGVKKLWLEPEASPNTNALDAIAAADAIIVCPGTLDASIIPNFLVQGMSDALKQSPAKKIYVANIINREGHVPAHWSVADYVHYFETYLGSDFFDVVIANNEMPKGQTSLVGVHEIPGCRIIALPLLLHVRSAPDSADVIGSLRSVMKHDPELVAGALKTALEK